MGRIKSGRPSVLRTAQPARKNLDKRARRLAPPFLLAALAAFLLLSNLGNQYLWQDEAQTALIAGTVLTHGVPLGTDGRNFFSQELGAEYGPNYVWRWHTWFPFYLLAGFFGVLGKTTFTARLPFALFGIATVVSSYYFAAALWRTRRAGVVAGLLVLTSVPFLILSRQCRYYGVAAFFAVLGLHAYVRLTERVRWAPYVFVAASVLLFHTHYLYSVALLAAVFADTLLLHRGAWKRVALACGVSLGVNLPWILWLSKMSYGKQYASNLLNPSMAAQMAPSFLGQLAKDVFPPLLLGVPLVLAVFPRRLPKGSPVRDPGWKRSILPVLFIATNLAALSLSAPAPFFRYLAPLLPVCAVLMAGIVDAAMDRQVWIGGVVLAGLVIMQPLRDYFYEITHDYDGPVEGIVGYLNKHGRPTDVVAITYEDLPVKFYTKMRVVGGLTGEDLAPAQNANWIVIRKYVISDKDSRVREYLVRNVPWQKYRKVQLDVPDIPFENRESPHEHRFRTVVGEDRAVIYQRIEP